MPDPLNSYVEKLATYAMRGFTDWSSLGRIRAVESADGRVLLNYTQAAQYANEWDAYEMVCRGLVIDHVGNVVARPFDKFFNWNERGRRGTGHIVNITEKMDGSLGIGYWYKGNFRIHTRGNFNSEQGKWAVEWAKQYMFPNILSIPLEATLLFEIVCPESRVVVDYSAEENGLYLLAVRETQSGDYWDYFPNVVSLASKCGFKSPKVYQFNNARDIIAACGTLDAHHEGWVVEYSDGSRWKFKGDAYRELHKALTSFSRKRVLDALIADTLDDLYDAAPISLHESIRSIAGELLDQFNQKADEISDFWAKSPNGTRAEFAAYVKEQCPHLSKFMFHILDNKPGYVELIYRSL